MTKFQILSSKDIASSRYALLHRQQMPIGDIVHINDIESRIYISRHPAIQEIYDYLPRRSRRAISWPKRKGWVYQYDR